MTVERIVIGLLLAVVLFLVLERLHYRQRVSDLYDTIVELTAGLDPKFEIRSHPELRKFYRLDAILDEMGAKLALLSEVAGRERDAGHG